jgi:DNA-directed RNA polymerase beta' subunit
MDCPGHFGHIDLAEQVFHYGFLDHLKSLLQCICIKCSNILVEKNDEQFKKAKIPFDLRNTITKDMPVLAFYYKQVTRLRKKIMPYFLLSASSHFNSIYNSLYENLDNRNKHFKLKKEVTNAR